MLRVTVSGRGGNSSALASDSTIASSLPPSEASCGRFSLMRIACPCGRSTTRALAISGPPSRSMALTSIALSPAITSQTASERRNSAAGVGAPNGNVILKSSVVRRAVATTAPGGAVDGSDAAAGGSCAAETIGADGGIVGAGVACACGADGFASLFGWVAGAALSSVAAGAVSAAGRGASTFAAVVAGGAMAGAGVAASAGLSVGLSAGPSGLADGVSTFGLVASALASVLAG